MRRGIDAARTEAQRILHLPDAEYERLMELLDDAPRPAGYALGFELGLFLRRRSKDLTRGREPILKGAGNLDLVWAQPSGIDPKVLISRYSSAGFARPSNTYLGLGLRSYFLALGDDRLLVWRQLRKPPPDSAIRMSLFDTRRLERVGKPRSWLWRYGDWDSVIWKDGLIASVDLPVELERGSHSVVYPQPMRISREILILASQFAVGRIPRTTILFVARPSEGVLEVVPFDWWKSRPRLRFIARVVRDAQSGNIVGDGVGVRPFSISPAGEFLGWLVPEGPT